MSEPARPDPAPPDETAGAEPVIDLLHEAGAWDADAVARLAGDVARRVLARLGLDPARWEISLLLTDDAHMAELNRAHRGKAGPTNVLSWPAQDLRPEAPGATPPLPRHFGAAEPETLGDIALARETVAREAEEQGKSFEAHLAHLLVHGVLHLAGYDHIVNEDAARMEQLEVELLANMGIADPYEQGGAGR